MPRTERVKSKTGIYHIVMRGINKQIIFEEEEDAVKFLQVIRKYQEKGMYKVYAYCLMGNHIHILLKEEGKELGVAMRGVGASYVYWYNLKYGRCGHLFQDRYKSEAVEDDKYFLTVLRYIHQNPLKAGMVKNIYDYKWSSYNLYLIQKKIIDIEFALNIFSNNRVKAMKEFKEFHKQKDDNTYLDIEQKRKILDEEAKEIIQKICRVNHCCDVQNVEKDLRNNYLNRLKEEGLSTRQITRLTGISRGIILKA